MRAPALAVAAFALAVASVAALAGRDAAGGLVKLPVPAGSVPPGTAPPSGTEELAYRVKAPLVDPGATAPGYRLASTTTPEAVAGLAQGLGLDGPVTEEDGGWAVASGDRRLVVRAEPGLPWFLGPCPARGGDGRRAPEPGGGCADLHVDVGPAVCDAAPPCPPTPPPTDFYFHGPPLPSLAEADQVAQRAFEGLGRDVLQVDADPYRFASVSGHLPYWVASMAPGLGGLRIDGRVHELGFGAGGWIAFGQGGLGRADRIGDYPLVGVDAGLRRLNGRAAAAVAAAAARCAASAATCGAPPPPQRTVTGVHLVLDEVGGYLVPTYEFELEGYKLVPAYAFELEAYTAEAPAVADEWLDWEHPAGS